MAESERPIRMLFSLLRANPAENNVVSGHRKTVRITYLLQQIRLTVHVNIHDPPPQYASRVTIIDFIINILFNIFRTD